MVKLGPRHKAMLVSMVSSGYSSSQSVLTLSGPRKSFCMCTPEAFAREA